MKFIGDDVNEIQSSGSGSADITNEADNRIFTSTGTATGLNAEANLSFTPNTLTIGPVDTSIAIIKRQDGSGIGGTLKIEGANGTGTDQSGGALKFYGGQGTGTGDGGDIEFWTSADGVSGSSLNTFGFLPRLSIDADGDTTIGGNLNIIGTIYSTGDATIFGNDIIFEGTTDDAHEATLSGGNPSSDIIVTLPASTGILALQNEDTTGNAATATAATTATLASGVVSIGNLSGDVTSVNRVTTIANDSVTEDKLANVLLAEIDANTLKVSNVDTNLTITGTAGARTIAASDGTNAIIPVATTSVSGLMDPATFDAIALNTTKVSNVDTNLTITGTAGARTIAASDGTNAIIPVATTSVSGLMDPATFDAIALNTTKVSNVDTNLTITGTAGARTIAASDGTNAIIPVATTSVSGLMDTTIFDEHTVNNAKTSHVSTDLTITGTTAARTIVSSTGTDVVIPVATTLVSGVMDNRLFDDVAANTAKTSNIVQTTITGNAGTATALVSGDQTIDGDLILSGSTDKLKINNTEVAHVVSNIVTFGQTNRVMQLNASTVRVSSDIELGALTDTTIARSAPGVVTIEGNTIATTNKSIETLNTGYYSSSTSLYYEPLTGYISENTSVSSYVSNIVAPFDGKIIRIAGYNSNYTSKTRTFKLFLNRQSSTQTGTSAVTASYTTKNMPELNPTDWTFSKGDSIAIQTTNSYGLYYANTTIVLEYDTTT